jgi:hypothetical protein
MALWFMFRLLAGHREDKPSELELVSFGSGGINSLKLELNDNRVMYGLLRTTEQIDQSVTTKFVFIYFVGEGVPFAKRGRYGVIKGDVVKNFQPYHVDFEISYAKEISKDLIKEKIADGMFVTASCFKSLATGTAIKAHGSEFAQGKSQRGFTATSMPNSPQGAVTTKGPQVATQLKESLVLRPEVTEAIKNLRNDKTNVKWLICSYSSWPQKNQPAELELLGSGSGADSEWKSLLNDNKIIYGLFRYDHVIDKSTTVKFVFLQFIGKEVPPTVKAKVSTLHGKFSSILI